MKVIFDESFLSRAERVDYTLTISSYIIGSYYKEVAKLSDLFSSDYLNNDSLKFTIEGENNVSGIWDEDKKILRLNINIAEDRKETLSNSENEYNLIYCFYRDLDSEKKIAFILSGDISKNNSSYTIDPLNLSINKNLVQVVFPKDRTIQANIKTNQDDDTSFLEGYGIEKGANVFRATSVKNPSEELTTLTSYYKYLRNIRTGDETGKDLPYLNVYGEGIYSNSCYFVYNRITLETKNTSPGTIPTDRTLKSGGGEIQFYGTYDRTRYIIRGGKVAEEIEESGNILNAADSVLIATNNSGLIFEIDNVNKKIIYSKNEDPNTSLDATFEIEAKNYNPTTGEISTLTSNSVILVQGAGNSTWNVISSTVYSEGGNRLYLFGPNRSEVQSFSIETDLKIEKDDDIRFEYEDQETIEKFFTISQAHKDNSQGITSINVTLSTKLNNESYTNWNPTVEVPVEEDSGDEQPETTIESKLLYVRIVVKDSREEVFYLVQGTQVRSMSLYKKISTNTYEKLTGDINLSSGNSVTLYPARDDGDEDHGKYWKIADIPENVIINPTSGELNDNTPNNWDGLIGLITSPHSVKITTYKTTDSIYEEFLGTLVFGRVDSEDSGVDFTNWRDAMTVGRTSVGVYLNGETPFIEQIDNITLYNLGCYYFYVKSNCTLDITITHTSSDGRIYFTDNGNTSITTETYNSSVGVPIYLTFDQNTSEIISSGFDLATIRITPHNYSGFSESRTVVVHVNNVEGSINHFTTDQFLYYNVVSTGSLTRRIDFSCNKSPMYNFVDDSGNLTDYVSDDPGYSYQGINISKTTVDYVNRGYNYSTMDLTFKFISRNYSWPVKYLGRSEIRPYGYTTTPVIYFYNFILGPTPSITIDGNSSVITKDFYLSSSSDSYVDIIVNSSVTLSSGYSTFIYADSDYNGNLSITTSATSIGNNGIRYNYRIRSLISNETSSSKYIGYILLVAEITPSQFINELSEIPDEVPITELTQAEINSIAGRQSKTIRIFQEGQANLQDISITLYGNSRDTVGPEGGSVVYQVSAPTGSTVELTNNTSSYGSASYSSLTSRISCNVYSIPTDDINLKTNGNYLADHQAYWNDREIDLNAYVEYNGSTSISRNFNLEIYQYGHKVGVVYGSRTTTPIMRFSDNYSTITERVNGTDTEFNFYLGAFPNWLYLVEDNEGENLTLDLSAGMTITKQETPIYRTGNGNPILYNVTVSFPENRTEESITRTVTATYYYNSYESIEFTINIIQGEKESNVISSIGDTVYFHSSGHCIMDSDELDVIDPAMETNIQRENFELRSNPANLLTDGNWSIDYVGSSTTNNGYSIYKLKGILTANKTEAIREAKIMAVDTSSGITKYTWNIKQGYLSIYLTDPSNKKIIGDGVVGSISQPFIVPAESNLGGNASNRVIFPLSASNREYDSSGVLGEEEEFNGNDYRIAGYTWNSTTGSLDMSTVFTLYSSDFVIESDQFPDKVPFIEQTYTTTQAYLTQEVSFIADVDVRKTYGAPVNEESVDYTFRIYLRKEAKQEVTITTDPAGPFNLGSEAGKVEFTVTCSAEDYSVTISEGSSWITRNNEATKPDENFYSFDIAENTTNNQRNGTISITSGDKNVLLEVRQEGQKSEADEEQQGDEGGEENQPTAP